MTTENALKALLATIHDEYGDVGTWEAHAPFMRGMPKEALAEIVAALKMIERMDELGIGPEDLAEAQQAIRENEYYK